MERREFLRVGGVTGALSVLAPSTRSEPTPPFELEEATVGSLQDLMSAGAISAVSLTQAYLDRIEALDRQGPTLRSVIETNPDALAIAEALDKERKEKGPRGPLHGIPVLVKDNIDTADRMTDHRRLAGPRGLDPGPATPSWRDACARRARSSSARRT